MFHRLCRLILALFCFAFALPASGTAAVTVGGLRYSIQSVSATKTLGDPAEGVGATADGEFIVLRLSVSNVGSQSADVSNSDFHLVRNHVTYDSASEATMYVSNAFFLKTLNPGVTAVGTVVFDVPANTAPSTYYLKAYGNGGGEPVYIRL